MNFLIETPEKVRDVFKALGSFNKVGKKPKPNFVLVRMRELLNERS